MVNRLQLEKAIEAQAAKISESGLIQKCIEVAENIGVDNDHHDPDSEWAYGHYIFEKAGVKIDVETYAMGDKKLEVDYEKKRVFEAKEGGGSNASAKYPNPLVAVSSHRFFEINHYIPGAWESRIASWYASLDAKRHEEVKPEELAEVQQRLGITV